MLSNDGGAGSDAIAASSPRASAIASRIARAIAGAATESSGGTPP